MNSWKEAPIALDKRHYTHERHKQRMLKEQWRGILLEHRDTIIYKGKVTKLKALEIGYGVVDVYKDLKQDNKTYKIEYEVSVNPEEAYAVKNRNAPPVRAKIGIKK